MWRQAITWTNGDPDHWHLYATLGGDKLNHSLYLQQPSGVSYGVSIQKILKKIDIRPGFICAALYYRTINISPLYYIY